MTANACLKSMILIFLAVASTASAFNAGDRVQCNGTGVNVRNTSCTATGSVSSPTQGTVQSGSVSCTGCSSSWANVNWDTGVTGYTCGTFLNLAPPFAPTLVGPGSGTSPGPTISGSSQTFQWNQSGGATNYGLFVRDLTSNTLVYSNSSVGNVTSTVVSGLAAGHQFRWNMQASNSAGTSSLSGYFYFQTQASCTAPTAITNDANPVTSSTATLNGIATPNGCSTTVYFDYGLTTNYGTTTSNQTFTGTNSQLVSANISALSPNTIYHFRLRANNNGGANSGSDASFTTSPTPSPSPVISSVSPNPVTATGSAQPIVINGSNFQTNPSVYVQWSSGSKTLLSSEVAYNSSSNITMTINVGTISDTWYVRVTNPDGKQSNLQPFSVQAASASPTPTPTSTPSATANPTPTPTATPIAGVPSISNVSPNPVPGSTASQRFTINGNNFLSSSVVNLRNITTGIAYLNRTVSSQTATALVINPVFGTEAHTWSVEVVNGTLSSGQFQFTVQTPTAAPRPDLIPSNVQASPTSVQIGNSVTVSATVSNPGPGDAVASTTRVRINTSTAGTSSADIALGDIATPAIVAGTSTTVSGSFNVPGGVPAGSNYVWVSLDNNKVTNESDGTNDYAHSPAVSVTGTTAAKPVIQGLTGDQTINHDEVATLSVTATGSGDLFYQWYRNNKPIPGATLSTIRTNQPGSYIVTVSNLGGTSTSGATTLTVNSFSNPPAPGTGSLTSPFAFNSFWPTVVITHGWEPTGDYNPNGESWQTDMALGVKGRFFEHAVNVLIYTWPEAYTHSYLKLSDARTATQSEGHQLAKSLRTFLGPDYQGRLQFVGHSYGTFLSAYAVYNITEHVDQVTILDAPIDVRSALVKAHYPNDDLFFRLLLPKTRVDYVDNYIATVPTAQVFLDGALFGGVIAGSAPNGGQSVEFSHVTIVGHYQDTTIAGNSYALGFNCSALLGANAQPIDRWNPPNLLQQTLEEFTDAASATSGDVTRAVDNVRGTSQDVFRLHTSGSASTAGSVRENQALATAGDSALEFEVSVPSDSQDMAFNFLFSLLGDGDWMTVSFADEVLYSFVGKSFVSSTYDEAVIPISKFAGQTGVVRVVLHSASATPTEVSVSNLHFESNFIGASALGNISTRLNVGTGDNALIGGFIITGTQPKKVIVRGIGSSLPFANKLGNPTLELRDSSGALVDFNDNWVDSPNKQAIIDSTIPPTNDLEAAIVATLPANNAGYTAILRGANNGTGIGVVEAYDLDQTVDSKLANISTRGFVDTGDNVIIGGTIIIGTSPANVLIRAMGPSLTTVPNALQDPTLELHDEQGNVITSNDNWRDTQEAAIIATTIPPSDNRESAILANLPPGQYTAIVRGKSNSTGVAVVEAYQLP